MVGPTRAPFEPRPRLVGIGAGDGCRRRRRWLVAFRAGRPPRGWEVPRRVRQRRAPAPCPGRRARAAGEPRPCLDLLDHEPCSFADGRRARVPGAGDERRGREAIRALASQGGRRRIGADPRAHFSLRSARLPPVGDAAGRRSAEDVLGRPARATTGERSGSLRLAGRRSPTANTSHDDRLELFAPRVRGEGGLPSPLRLLGQRHGRRHRRRDGYRPRDTLSALEPEFDPPAG